MKIWSLDEMYLGKLAMDNKKRDGEHERLHGEEESASKIGRVWHNLNYMSNIGFHYKTNVNKMMLTLTSVFFKKPMLTGHTLTSVFKKSMLTNIG